jgi:hypothetical protein
MILLPASSLPGRLKLPEFIRSTAAHTYKTHALLTHVRAVVCVFCFEAIFFS